MIEHLRNMVRAEVARALDRRARRIPAIVDSYDPARFAVKVKMQPEGTLSGWISIETPQVGGGFGVMIAPNIGDPGWIEFHEDDFNAGVFVGSSFNERFKPVPIVAGEILLKHKSGASFYLKDDGSVTVTDKASASVKLDGNALVTITDKAGSRVVLDGAGTADIYADTINLGPEGSSFVKLITDAFVALFNAHTHPGNNQPPDVSHRLSSAQLTSRVNAV